jgi:epoxyqueuosine reductase QueG
VAMGNTGQREQLPEVERFLDDPDPMLREHASWAAQRLRRLPGPVSSPAP